ncbi:MAG: ABC transporter permease [Proteobacteria bacterium]|nr:ABC transporter permease [Pseudomonadota bacterium]
MELIDIALTIGRLSAPLILVALGGYLSEKSGVVNIALEGLILFGAFFAATFTTWYGNPWLGLIMGALVASSVGFFYALLTVGLQSDQIVAGTAINMLAWGGIPFLGKVFFDSTSSTPALDLDMRIASWVPILTGLMFVLLFYYLSRKTRIGLWHSFAGEKPEALSTVGVSVTLVRFAAVTCAGFVAGLGGAFLSISLASSYTRNMSAGRGFMALGALILGKWRPVPTLVACLVFGASEMLQLRLQGIALPMIGEIPSQIVQIFPYILTLILLMGFVGESRAPAALGKKI